VELCEGIPEFVGPGAEGAGGEFGLLGELGCWRLMNGEAGVGYAESAAALADGGDGTAGEAGGFFEGESAD
jgi:hypothetical protein